MDNSTTIISIGEKDGKFIYSIDEKLINGLSIEEYNGLKAAMSAVLNSGAFMAKDKRILESLPKKNYFEYDFFNGTKAKVFFNTFEEFSNIYNVKCFHAMAHFNGFVVNGNKEVFVYYTEPIRKIKIGSFGEVPDFCYTNPIFKVLNNLHGKLESIMQNQKPVPTDIHSEVMKRPQDFV